MGRGHKNRAVYFTPFFKDEDTGEQLPGVFRKRSLGWGLLKNIAPNRILTAIAHHHPRQQPSHAVTDHDDRFVIWKRLVEPIEVAAQECRRVRKWIAAWVSEEPELIGIPNFRVAEQGIKHWHPCSRRVLQPVDKEDRNPLSIVGLQPVEQRRVFVFRWMQEAFQGELLRFFAHEKSGDGGAEIAPQRKTSARHRDGFLVERVLERNFT